MYGCVLVDLLQKSGRAAFDATFQNTYWYTSEHFTISYEEHFVGSSVYFNVFWTTTKSERLNLKLRKQNAALSIHQFP